MEKGTDYSYVHTYESLLGAIELRDSNQLSFDDIRNLKQMIDVNNTILIAMICSLASGKRIEISLDYIAKIKDKSLFFISNDKTVSVQVEG